MPRKKNKRKSIQVAKKAKSKPAAIIAHAPRTQLGKELMLAAILSQREPKA